VKRMFVLAALALIGSVATASAQETTAGGIKAGVNVSTLKYYRSSPPDTGTRQGFFFGVLTNSPFNRRVGLQTEFLWSQKGAKVSGLKMKLDYFEVPMLLDIRLNTTGKSRASLLLGGHYGILLKARANSTNIKPAFEKLDLGLVAGLGVTTGEWVIDGKYSWGLRNIIANKSDKVKNRTLQIGLTKKFRF
jgi:opacity protein-like surface antigen